MLLIAIIALFGVYPCLAEVTSICGSCCPQQCGLTLLAYTLTNATSGLAEGYTIASGSNLTCYKGDDIHPGAVNRGLCVPQVVPNVSSFCSDINNTATLKVVDTKLYQGAFEQKSACSPCCDGHYVCGMGMQCYQTASWANAGVCIPAMSSFSPGYCGAGVTIMNKTHSCENCQWPGQPPPAQNLRSYSEDVQAHKALGPQMG